MTRFDPQSLLSAPHSRRAFLKRIGGGIAVFVTVHGPLGLLEHAAASRVPADFNAFVRIAPDGSVTCFTGKIEMGQGPVTSLVQMMADELEVPYERVDIVMGDTDRCPWDLGTWGSLTTRAFGPIFRAAAAEARQVLIQLASEKLDVPISQLRVREGVVFDRRNEQRRITYGALAKGKPIARHLRVDPKLKDVSEFRIMGKSKLRRDSLEKVTGQAKYAADIRLPGMLYAKILRPPAHGAKLTRVDTSRARKFNGVRVVEDGDLVAVLHELPDVAEKALGGILAQFDEPRGGVSDANIHDHLLKVASKGSVADRAGDLDRGRKRSTRAIETTYFDGYVAHAPIETHSALATIENGKCTIWASTQNPFGAREKVADAIDLPEEKIRVITPFVGGGFGGKTRNWQVVEAARLAKTVGRPVQVMRSRDEEFFYDPFRPAAVVHVRSGIDDAGSMAFWDYEVLFAGQRGAPHFYDIPNHRTIVVSRGRGGQVHPFPTGAWRAPANNTNTFARESQIDAMAAAAGADPIAFRLKHLKDRRMIRVLKAAAKRFDWKPARTPSKRGVGVACGIDAGTYVAAIGEVGVDAATGEVDVKRVTIAQDMGIVINPQGAAVQMEGCVTMGLGYALSEEVRFEGGKVLDTNFHRYEIPRFSGLPEIDTVLVEANEIPPQGGGEPAIVVMGGVIANAIYDATGARCKRMPMTPARVKAAIQEL